MPQDINLWAIDKNDELHTITKNKLDLEGRLEDWLEKDIGMISNDLIVIGRQVTSAYGGAIDILCMDRNGDLVIIELKREKTPRDVTAQVLDYASWVKNLSTDKVIEIANNYLGSKNIHLEDVFKDKFEGTDIPDELNEHHKMLIVASEIDPSSERIIKYLSESYGIDINAITFRYFKNGEGKEYLARAFLIDPADVKHRRDNFTGRNPPLSYEQLEQIAEENGVSELYKKITEGVKGIFDYTTTSRSTIGYIGNVEGGRITMFSIYPIESNMETGLCFKVYKLNKIAKYFNINKDEIVDMFPKGCSESKHIVKGEETDFILNGYFKNLNEIDVFLEKIKKAVG